MIVEHFFCFVKRESLEMDGSGARSNEYKLSNHEAHEKHERENRAGLRPERGVQQDAHLRLVDRREDGAAMMEWDWCAIGTIQEN